MSFTPLRSQSYASTQMTVVHSPIVSIATFVSEAASSCVSTRTVCVSIQGVAACRPGIASRVRVSPQPEWHLTCRFCVRDSPLNSQNAETEGESEMECL